MTNDEGMTKSEGPREHDDAFWLDGETYVIREEPGTTPVYDLQVLEGRALRRQLREPGSQELAPPVPQASRMRRV
jgi:hypothetical protein